jgi:two-component system cell cycle sensor histidine kinase/response regulator CckA
MPNHPQLWQEPGSPRKNSTKDVCTGRVPVRAWLECCADAVFITDADGLILEANEGAAQLHGVRPEQLAGLSLLDLVAPESRQHLLNDFLPWARSGTPALQMVRWTGAAGTTPAEIRASRFRRRGAAALLVNVRDLGEQGRWEEELDQSEKRYSALFESNPLPMLVYDPESLAFLAVNAAALCRYGFSRDEFLAMTLTDLCTPEQAPAFLRSLPGHREEQVQSGPWKHRRKDATVFDVELTTHNLPFGKRSARLVLASDVSQRVRAEQALRQQRALLENIITHIPGSVFWKDRQGVYLGCNEGTARDLGRPSPADVIGLTDFDMPFSREEAEFYRQCDRQVMETEKPLLNIEETQRRPDGSQAVLLTSKVPLRDDEGRVIGTLGVYADITSRKRTEQLVEQRERLFRAVIEAAGAVPYTRNYVTNQFEYVGPGIEALLGYTPEEFSTELWELLTLEVFLPGQTKGTSAQDAKNVFRNSPSVSWYADARVRTKTGEDRWLFNAAVKIFDESGELVSSWGLLQDITERRRLEEHARQSQKMEAIGRLAGGVAHDFNNLLTVINGYGDVLLRQFPEGDQQHDAVRQIVSAGERAAKLTGQLLAFSRKALLAPRVLDLRTVVADMDQMLRRLIGEDIELVTIAAPDLGLVKADPGHIEQIILNLVCNARDAMPQGGKLTIEVGNVELDESYARTQPDAVAGRHVLLAVTDTGVGMDQPTRARIFEPFFSRKGDKGTGLGLATVYGAVRQNGGHITCYSESGEGACFKVYLPRLSEVPRAEAASTARAVMPRGTETILLAEDEQAVRDLARRILEGCGYTVLTATNGLEATTVAAQHRQNLQLLVTDVIMPKMGGRELADRLVRQDPRLKVLFLSGYTDDAVVRHGILECEVAFLQKPFSPAVLAQKVREVLDQRQKDPVPAEVFW